MSNSIVLEIGDFLGFCDMNGVDAISSEQVQELEEYISQCNDAYHSGSPLVVDAIWDRLMEILRQVNPDSELCQHIWEDSVDKYDNSDSIVQSHPMYSIQTVKSLDCDEINGFVDRLPAGELFDAHVSMKLNGHGIRLKYKNGEFFQARSRARSSAGRDITKQLAVTLADCDCLTLDALSDVDLCEIRGEWVLPLVDLDTARSFNPDIKSAFSAVASMGRDSGTEEEWGLLHFVAYEFLAEGVEFASKQEEYDYLSELGFETPMCWLIEGLSKETLMDELPGIISDCESDSNEYDYYTDGLVFAINNTDDFRALGDDGGHYKYGNMALKVGRWKQDIYDGYVQCIMWMKGKTKLTPVAIIGAEPDMWRPVEYTEKTYVYDKKEIANWNELGVVTASGNTVRRVPLYEPNNIVVLDAYPGSILHFRYGSEAGVVPCFEDGTPLIDGRIQQALGDNGEEVFIFGEEDYFD